MIFLVIACASEPAPGPRHWAVEVQHSRHLFHTREISIHRVDAGQIGLTLAADGTATLQVGQRYTRTNRSSKYAPHGPSKTEDGQTSRWAATGKWTAIDGGLRVHLDQRYAATWSTDGPAAAADLTLTCREADDDLFCTGIEDDLRYLSVTDGEERRPWPGTRWIRSADATPVLWLASGGASLGSRGVEQPAEMSRQAITLDAERWVAD